MLTIVLINLNNRAHKLNNNIPNQPNNRPNKT